jgi:hypothetical protein
MNKLLVTAFSIILLLANGSASIAQPAENLSAPEPSGGAAVDPQDVRIRQVLPEYQPSFVPSSVSDVVSLNPIKLQISVVDKTPVITQDPSRMPSHSACDIVQQSSPQRRRSRERAG